MTLGTAQSCVLCASRVMAWLAPSTMAVANSQKGLASPTCELFSPPFPPVSAEAETFSS